MGQVLHKIWDWLTAPGPFVPPGERRKARLVSAVLLVVLLAALVELVLAPGAPVIAAGLLAGIYALSRTRWYRAAAALLVIALSIDPYYRLLSGDNIAAGRIVEALVWTALPLILSSLLFTWKGTAAVGLLHAAALVVLATVRPETAVDALQRTLPFIVVTTLVILLVQRQRDLLELDREAELRQSRADLETAYDETLRGWSHALELREQETAGHSQRVVDLTVRLAREMGLPEEQFAHIRRGALLHDIGKMGIPDSILLKRGPLTAAEWLEMKKHPGHAAGLLSRIPFLAPAMQIPCHHHERWDGSGYPDGLTGEDIPLPARIFAVVDCYDALLSDRSYRTRWSDEQARKYLSDQAGVLFDPKVVDRFLGMLEEDAPRQEVEL